MNSIIINILFSILLINFCVISGCFGVQCIEEVRENWSKKERKDNSQENDQ